MTLLTTILTLALSGAPQHPGMPPGMSHEEHLKQMQKDDALKKRGAEAMGFDQDAAVHHFRLFTTGGAIEVEALRRADAVTRDQIRGHLKQITDEFARGDFAKPHATHAEVPPGVPLMQERHSLITYRYEETARGARVVIDTTDAEALQAIHTYLRYQIAEHKTGDSTVPGKRR